MEEERQRWNKAKTWAELCALNKDFIHRSAECKTHIKDIGAPFHPGPRRDCRGCTDDYLQTLVKFHEYGILTTYGKRPSVTFWKHFILGGKGHTRNLPYLEFILSCEEESGTRFLNSLVGNKRFSTSIRHSSGAIYPGTNVDGPLASFIQYAAPGDDLQTSPWYGSRAPVEVENPDDCPLYHMQTFKKLQGDKVYICDVTPNMGYSPLEARDDDEFLQKAKDIDFLRKILNLARKAYENVTPKDSSTATGEGSGADGIETAI
ncbi:hypothetical protein FALBO_4611 [Fusarium albosuccineum]|uniref:Uncharacterized protein n=1 Tax=Fusarium albosuccineum TaxID=1237068 RepID=A0A8H4PAL0_9HYPO|nr:hypothetical protein FALBO_4611 [Fusarium albosuccineum]